MQTDPIIYQEQLSKMSGYKNAAHIARWLKRQGIGYTVGKDGLISTTIAALDSVTIKKTRGTKIDF